MYLLPPDVLNTMLCSGEFKSFLKEMLPSVPDRTRSRLLAGQNPSPKTRKAIFDSLVSARFLSGDELFSWLEAQTGRPWTDAITGLKKGMRRFYPGTFDYAGEIITRIEEVSFTAIQAKQNGEPDWRKHAFNTGLPEEVMPTSHVEALFNLAEQQPAEKRKRVVPADTGEVLLRTNLFVLSAIEVSFQHSDLTPNDMPLWVHKFIPYYRENKLINPMREFFETLMDKINITSIAELARRLHPFSIPKQQADDANQKRQIYRWIKGEVPLSWEYMHSISDIFFDGQEGPLYSYGVARFLQALFNELQKNAIPNIFTDESELVRTFQEYPAWQVYHQKEFENWSAAKDWT